MQPVLSVLIFNYNHGVFLKDRIESVLTQLPPKSELVLLDDASTDDSIAIATPIAKHDARFRIVVNEKNLGVVKNFNRGPSVAQGTYYLPLAADDFLLPGAISKILNPLLQKPSAGFGTSIFAFHDTETSKEWIQPIPKSFQKKAYVRLTPKQMVFFVKKYSLSCGSLVIMKKELWFKFGGYQEKLGLDWFFNHALSLTEESIFIPEVLHYWRKRPSSFGGRVLTKEEKKQRLLSILKHLSRYPFLRKQFLRSQVLYPECRKHFATLLSKPQYYDFVIQTILKRTPLIKKVY